MTTLDDHELLTANEAADYLRISLQSLRRWEKEGKLLPVRVNGSRRKYFPADTIRAALTTDAA